MKKMCGPKHGTGGVIVKSVGSDNKRQIYVHKQLVLYDCHL